MRPQSPSELLTQAGTPAFLVTNLVNLYYLTGLELSAGAVLVTARRMTLFTDARYSEAATKSARPGMLVRDMAALPSALKILPLCGCESETVTLSQYRNWKRKYPNTKFVQARGVIEAFRRQKDEQELRFFRRAQRITNEMMRRVPSQLRTSITERKLAWQLRSWAVELGAEDLSFPAIVAFGTHTSRPHHAPTDRKLTKGMLVQIDVGARYKGYCADQSEVFFTASPSAQQERVYQALCTARDAAIVLAKAGTSTHALDQAARAVLAKAGIEEAFTHSLGHGVGLEIHEGVSLTQRQPATALMPGEIITIEPGAYFPGKWGMRVETEVIIK